ncbi:MAG: sulfatase [bacterium]
MSRIIPRRQFLARLSATGSLIALPGCASVRGLLSGLSRKRDPNIVIIFTDDQGYADVGCFGAEGFETPNLDAMAEEGIRFTDFHVAQPVCGASRAALLTGCYPNRIGMLGAPSHRTKHGINDDEMLLSELLKQRDYATAIFGKWHLGCQPQFLPPRHGFDEYFGLPYSNDMWPKHPEVGDQFPPLPLIEGDEVIALNPDQTQLTTWYTERGVRFIEKNKDRPFFLYVAHSMPHVPLHVSDKFKGKSKQGMYGDVIMEIDWSVGKILTTLKQLGLDEDTLVIFTSDNGPWLSYGDHAGCAKPLREGKGTTWDGGHREPCIMRWPGKIPAGAVCGEPVMTIDIFPTIARLADTRLPDHDIDGLDIWPLISGVPNAKSPHVALYFYWNNDLEAVRSGKWKLHFPHTYRTLSGRPGGTGGIPVKYDKAEICLVLYDLENDIGEQHDVSAQYPEVVKRLQALADKVREELGDGEKKGKGYRPPAQVEE